MLRAAPTRPHPHPRSSPRSAPRPFQHRAVSLRVFPPPPRLSVASGRPGSAPRSRSAPRGGGPRSEDASTPPAPTALPHAGTRWHGYTAYRCFAPSWEGKTEKGRGKSYAELAAGKGPSISQLIY